MKPLEDFTVNEAIARLSPAEFAAQSPLAETRPDLREGLKVKSPHNSLRTLLGSKPTLDTSAQDHAAWLRNRARAVSHDATNGGFYDPFAELNRG